MTAQMHEKLILNGEETSMAFCPPLPEGHSRIKVRDDWKLRLSACWRGYVGTWEIKGGRLYLVSLDMKYELLGSEPLFADWVTAVLRVPCGNRLQNINMGFGTVYEEELHIKVEKGVVSKTRVIDNCDTDHDFHKIARNNLPGGENRFPGDDEI